MQGDYEQDETKSDAADDDLIVCIRLAHPASKLMLLQCDAADPSNNDCDNMTTSRTPLDFPLARRQWIDSAVSVKGSIPEVISRCVTLEGSSYTIRSVQV